MNTVLCGQRYRSTWSRIDTAGRWMSWDLCVRLDCSLRPLISTTFPAEWSNYSLQCTEVIWFSKGFLIMDDLFRLYLCWHCLLCVRCSLYMRRFSSFLCFHLNFSGCHALRVTFHCSFIVDVLILNHAWKLQSANHKPADRSNYLNCCNKLTIYTEQNPYSKADSH